MLAKLSKKMKIKKNHKKCTLSQFLVGSPPKIGKFIVHSVFVIRFIAGNKMVAFKFCEFCGRVGNFHPPSVGFIAFIEHQLFEFVFHKH